MYRANLVINKSGFWGFGYLMMRLIWWVEKEARSIPQRTARRASRFNWFRLFLASDSESLVASWSDGIGSLCNLSPRDRWWKLRRAESTVVNERRGEKVCVTGSEGEERIWCSVTQLQQWWCNVGHCFRSRNRLAIFLCFSVILFYLTDRWVFSNNELRRIKAQRKKGSSLKTTWYLMGQGKTISFSVPFCYSFCKYRC